MTPISKIKKCYIMRIKMLVYVVWAFVLALGVQSCHQPDVLPEAVRYPILFGSSDSRAVATLDNLKTEGFRVHAYFKGEGAATFDQIVNYHEDQNIWALSNPEYWIPGVTYWFKAFYPKDLAVDITINDGKSQSYSINDYDIRNQMDIMVASADELTVPADGVAPTSGSVVNLNFQHLLACVAIEVTSEDDNVLVKSLSLGGIDNMGDYDGTTWSADNTTSIDINLGITLDDSPEYTDLTNGGILVIPQEVKGIELVVVANKEYRVEIPADKTPVWNKGTKYTYKLTIKKNNITFVDKAPYTEEWDSESATGSVIIK